ncbi:MAG TPA: xanthine dehydrogenase family protein molybdopterin-binding subunit [Acidimicrobiia bacterium]|nr:xanthine dehydrogenase family protein molybdopterin-binding subunit [Acidimicrobiia bacterium]
MPSRRRRPSEPWQMRLGESIPRVDARGKTTGEAVYPSDIHQPDFLYAVVVFTNQPHARIRRLDVSAARAIPGVVEVFTSADVPVNEYGLVYFDQPVFIGVEHTGRSSVPCEVSRWEADHLALVVGESLVDARQGAAAIEAEWEELPVLADMDSALDTDILLHPESGKDSNAYHHLRIRKGDPEAAWTQAEVTVEGDYEFPYQEHAYLQPEAAVSYIDEEGRVTVEIAGQWVHEDQEQIAHALDMPAEKVRVIYPAVGGAFGGREDMSLQIVMTLASWRLHQRGIDRPLRAVWSREESMVGHHKRHRGRVHARLGATTEGKIVALEADCYLDAGGYNYTSNKVLGNLHLTVAGPYEIPNARIDSYAVYTNSVPGGAFRGFGAPQGALVAETQMNKLAEVLGMDPVELRLRNLLKDDSTLITGAEMPPGVSITKVVRAADDAARVSVECGAVSPFATLPPKESSLRRGRGFACAFKNIGFSFGFPERCEASVELHGSEHIEKVTLFHGGAEVGQGAHTVFKQMAAEAAGVDVGAVETVYSDTAFTGDSGSASASRLTWMAGNSILGATEEALKRWHEGDRPARGHFRFTPPPTEVLDPESGSGQPNFAYGYVAEVVDLTVDIETGHIFVDRVICADDVGRAINRALIEGQVEGAIVQAHGYAVTEDLPVEDGRVLYPRLSAYLIPGIGDIPASVETVLIEVPDPRGPWGARGMAEMPLVPYAAAVVAAIHDATGVWFHQVPLTPSRLLAGLH